MHDFVGRCVASCTRVCISGVASTFDRIQIDKIQRGIQNTVPSLREMTYKERLEKLELSNVWQSGEKSFNPKVQNSKRT